MATHQKIKYPLWLAHDNGESPRFTVGGSAPDYFDNATPVESIDQVTLKQIVQGLDEGLEDGNYHTFAGMAATLKHIIVKNASEGIVKKVLWDVACRGGFDELGG